MSGGPTISVGPWYITRRGAKVLQDELHELRHVKRPKIVQEVADAAAQGDRSENAEYIYGKKKLREFDRRILFLLKRLESVTVIDPELRPENERSKIFFGATVDLEDEDGNEVRYQIVGADESDLRLGRISYQSPIGSALLKKRVGDVVTVKRPVGDLDYTVLAIVYE